MPDWDVMTSSSGWGILRAALMSQMVGGDYIGALEFNATPGSESSATFY